MNKRFRKFFEKIKSSRCEGDECIEPTFFRCSCYRLALARSDSNYPLKKEKKEVTGK